MDESKKTPYTLKLVISGLPTGMNDARGKWKKYQDNKKWKSLVWTKTKNRLPEKPLERVKITYTRASSGILDWDNLAISFKAPQDGLVEAGVMVDDKVKNIPTMPTYRQIKAPPKKGYIVIELEELL